MSHFELVREFAPILHFHPEESVHCCFPSDAEKIYEANSKDWENFPISKTPKELDETAPCYYEIWLENRLVQIRYWFWYNYNDFPGTYFGLGDHLGDWEHVEVRLYKDRRIENAIWLVSNHLEARVASMHWTLPGFEREDPILGGKHLHVWAALGSHANYPSPKSTPYCYAKIFCDKIMNNGPVWQTELNLKRLDDTNFRDFTGRWGDSKAPRSPRNEYNNRWRNAPDVEPVHNSSDS